MENKQINTNKVEYSNNDIIIKSDNIKKGENQIVFPTPNSQIKFDSKLLDIKNIKYKIVGGDVVVELPNGGTYTFVSMAIMGDNAPNLIIGTKSVSLEEILGEIDNINELPVNSVVTNQKIEIQPNELKKEDSSNKNQNIQNFTEVETQTKSADLLEMNTSTLDNINISKNIEENSFKYKETETSSADNTKKNDNNAVSEGTTPSLTFTLDIQHVKADGSEIGRTLDIQGGGGIYYANIFPGTNQSANITEVEKQTKAENLNYALTSNSLYEKVLIHADNVSLFSETTTSRMISISASQPEGFGVSSIEVTVFNAPDNFLIQHGTYLGANKWIIEKDNKNTNEIEGFTIDSSGKINFIITDSNQKNIDFELEVTVNSTFNLENIDVEKRGDFTIPKVSEIENTISYGINQKTIENLNESSSYYFTPFIGKSGKLIESGFVITNNINTNEIKGANEISNEIYGSFTDETITGGNKEDLINANSGNDKIIATTGNDVIDGGEGIDILDFSNIDNSSNIGINADLINNSITGLGEYIVKNIENLSGTQDNDILIGNELDNKLIGNSGNDTIDGGLGNDILNGGLGNDIIDGGLGNDVIDGGTGNDTVDFSNNKYTEGVIVNMQIENEEIGNGIAKYKNEIDTLKNIENVIGTNFDDKIYGNDLANEINTKDGNDIIDGGLGNDIIDGGLGNDTIDFSSSIGSEIIYLENEEASGASGYDKIKNIENIIGTNFDDKIYGDINDNKLNGNSGNDIIEGKLGNDTIDGGLGNDTLKGGEGNDLLAGGAGEDILYGGEGNDIIDGGEDIDIVNYEESLIGVSIDLTIEEEQNTIGAGLDILKNIENVAGTGLEDLIKGNEKDNIILSGGGNDIIIATGSSILGKDTVNGGGGTDTISFETYTTEIKVDLSESGIQDTKIGNMELINIENAIGGKNNDILIGNIYSNVLVGYEGDDNLDGLSGNDFLYGDLGNDILEGGLGNDELYGEEGNDTIIGNIGNDIIDGGNGIDLLTFENNLNAINVDLTKEYSIINDGFGTKDKITNIEIIKGSIYADIIKGDENDNILEGNAGDDLLEGNSGNDVLDGEEGNDTIDGGLGNDIINGGLGNDIIDGGLGDDIIDGGLGNDTLNGGEGIDTVDGGDGNDVIKILEVDATEDIFIGNTGTDTIDYSELLDTDNNILTGGINVNLKNGETSFINNNVIDKIETIENIKGTQNNDQLTGDEKNNTILGESGDDIILGESGDDSLNGGAGNDIIDGGAGNDIEEGNEGNDRFIANLGTNVIIGGTGTDTIDFGSLSGSVNVNLNISTSQNTFGTAFDTLIEIENVIGTNFDDNIKGNSFSNNLSGGLGEDIILGDSGNDVIIGGLGNDTLIGGSGDDILDGGDDIDTASYELSNNGININYNNINGYQVSNDGIDGTDKLLNIEIIKGSNFNDVFIGGTENLTFKGNLGDDVITGGSGNESLEGNEGTDTFIINTNNGEDIIDGGTGTDTVNLKNINSDIEINLSGNTPTNIKINNVLDDSIKNVENVLSGNGNDKISGDDFSNYIETGAGNDILDGGAGNDILDGGDGIDTLSLTSLNNISSYLVGGKIDLEQNTATDMDGGNKIGNDTIYNIENLQGSKFDDILKGNENDNNIVGEEGNDILFGRAGNDILDGGEGNDTIDGGAGNDTLNGGAGVDTADYSLATNSLDINLNAGNTLDLTTVGLGIDTLNSIEGIKGSNFNDRLQGTSEANILDGGKGDDILIGGGSNSGVDVIDGGEGNDFISYSFTSQDLILDLNGGNNIQTTAVGDIIIKNVENLQGGAGNDELFGDLSANTLWGESGNDILHGRLGNDILDGGKNGYEISVNFNPGTIYSFDLNGVTVTYNSNVTDTLKQIINGLRLSFEAQNNIGTITTDETKLYILSDFNINNVSSNLNETLKNYVDTADYSDVSSGNGIIVDLSLNTNQIINDGFGTKDTLIDIEVIKGTAYNDNYKTSINNDIIYGGAGEDIFYTSSGEDKLNGGAGDDRFIVNLATTQTIIDGFGTPSQSESAFDRDTVDFQNINNYFVSANLTTGNLIMSNGVDTITINSSNIENLIGTEQNDIIIGSSEENLLEGKGGNDTFDVSGTNNGKDTIDGGLGNDTVDYSNNNSNKFINVELQNNNYSQVLISGEDYDMIKNIENITGSKGNDIIKGNDDNNILSGSDGDDILSGSLGNDVLDGGDGIDTVDYFNEGALTIDLSSSNLVNIDGFTDTLLNIENIIGSNSFNDTIKGDLKANIINGAGGNDILDGGAGNDTLIGGSGDDTFKMSNINDGMDIIYGGTNNAGLNNGDNLDYSNISADITLKLGDDNNTAGTVDFVGGTLDQVYEIENVIGGLGNDILEGNKYNNKIDGSSGNDTLIGGLGNDILIGGAGNDTVDYSKNNNSHFINVTLEETGDTIVSINNETSDTISSIENVSGSQGNDTITGNSINNELNGEDGNDIIDGGLGNDIIDGGLGNDTIDYSNRSNSVLVDLNNNNAHVDIQNNSFDSNDEIDNIINIENVKTTDLNDIVYTNDLENQILTLSGDDLIYGSRGNDNIDGGDGNDTINYISSANSLDISLELMKATDKIGNYLGTDTLINIENVVGSIYDDIIEGNINNNVINGGIGNDTISFKNSTNNITVDLGNVNTQNTNVGIDTLISIENVIGSSFNDILKGNQNTTNILSGGSGNDTFLTDFNVVLTDNYDGETGNDTIDYSAFNSIYELNVSLLGSSTALSTLTNTNLALDSNINIVNIENVIGTEGNDVITGDDVNNSLSGNKGNDILNGGNGNDTLDGGLGDDILDGGNGIDILNAGDGNDSLFGGLGIDVIDGGEGIDTINYTDILGNISINLNDTVNSFVTTKVNGVNSDTLKNIENITTSSGTDSIIGDNKDNIINAGSGNDILIGSEGNDVLNGEDGDDIFKAGTDNNGDSIIEGLNDGIDTINGGDGNDTVDYSNLSVTNYVTINLNNTGNTTVSINGHDSDIINNIENIIGTKGNDIINGNIENNILNGEEGNDILVGEEGNDVIDGGLGNDTVSYETSSSYVNIDMNITTGEVIEDGYGFTDNLNNIEIIYGSNFNDIIKGNNNNETLIGGIGADTISGGAGADTLKGYGLISGTDNDVDTLSLSYVSNTATTTIDLENGLSIVNISGNTSDTDILEGFENVIGSAGNDLIIGSTVNNNLNGAEGNDTFISYKNDGIDVIDGGDGIDTINYSRYNNTNDTINISLSNSGPSTVIANSLNEDSIKNIENIIGSTGNDILNGNYQNNILDGEKGNDILNGKEGDDTLIGGEGNDILIGGEGNDSIDGGLGNDTIDYSSVISSVSVNLNQTTITVGSNQGIDTISSIENVIGSNFNDTFISNSTVNNIIDGGDGIDTIKYTTISDKIEVDLINNLVKVYNNTVNTANDTLLNIENVEGTTGDDIISGNNNNNILKGLEGNDIIVGNGGNDTIDGGLGIDTVSYEADIDSVSIDLNTGLTNSTSSGVDNLISIENIIGSSNNDLIVLKEGTTENIIDGKNGTDTVKYTNYTLSGININLSTGNAQTIASGDKDTLVSIENIETTNLNDTIIGSALSNNIIAGNGDDIIKSGVDTNNDGILETITDDGTDTIDGGEGNDTIDYSSILDDGNNLTKGIQIDLESNNFSQVIVRGQSANDIVKNIENVIGTKDDDIISGDNLNNNINGNLGSDIISGEQGNDILNGGDGNDILNGGDGNDILYGENNDDILIGELGNDDIYGGNNLTDNGIDTIDYSSSVTDLNILLANGYNFGTATGADIGNDRLKGIENLISGLGNDTIIANTDNNNINSGAGNDIVDGGLGNDIINTGIGNDKIILRLNDGLDIIDGELGNDTVDYSSINSGNVLTDGINLVLNKGSLESVYINSVEQDKIKNIENVIGTTNNDIITSDSYSNTINGGLGKDEVKYTYDNGTGIKVDLDIGEVEENGSVKDTLIAIEKITASLYADTFKTSKTINNEIDGGNGIDTIDYSGFNNSINLNLENNTVLVNTVLKTDTIINIEKAIGTEFNDTLIGTTGNEIFYGGSGNDTVDGKGGNDILKGESGNDTFIGTTFTNNDIDGGSDIDTIDYSTINTALLTTGINIDLNNVNVKLNNVNNHLISNIENVIGTTIDDTIKGNSLSNDLKGGLGNDIIDGGSGDDILEGQDGNDTLNGGSGDDILNGGNGIDTLNYTLETGNLIINLALSGNGGGIGTDTYTSIENVNSGTGTDVITGTINDNIINAGGGNDIVDGGIGNDIVNGEDGNDILDGGIGNDNILGGNGDDIINGNNGDDIINGENGSDTINYSLLNNAESINVDLSKTISQFISSSYGNDTLSNIENIIGSKNNDILTGNINNNIIDGGEGDDIFYTKGGIDTFIGGLGNDTINLSTSTQNISINLANLEINGNTSSYRIQNDGLGNVSRLTDVENVIGSNYNDIIYGDTNNNIFSGGSGNDVFKTGGGNDIIDGGNNIDTLDFSDIVTTAVVIDLDNDDNISNGTNGTATFGSSTTTFSSIENVIGTLFDDYISGNGNINIINGGNGIDTVNYFSTLATSAISIDLSTGTVQNDGFGNTETLSNIENINGTNFNDTITGDSKDNKFISYLGNDTLIGGSGNDILIGGIGADIFKGGSGDDIIYGNIEDIYSKDSDIDTIDYSDSTSGITINISSNNNINMQEETIVNYASNTSFGQGTDNIYDIQNIKASTFNDVIIGNEDNNVIYAGAGNDIIKGEGGQDTIYAETGNDTILGSLDNDVIDGGTGTDTIDYSHITGIAINADLNKANNQIVNILDSTDYDNLSNIENIIGSIGNDIIKGTDNYSTTNVLNGYKGNDTFISSKGIDNYIGGAGTDTLDFSNTTNGINVNVGLGIIINDGYENTGVPVSETLIEIEVIKGSAFADTITGGGNIDYLYGNNGNDIIDASGANDIVDGGLGNDSINGGTGDDNILGGLGDDTIDGGDGNDIIDSGDGNDIVKGSLNNDTITLGLGTDTLSYQNYSLNGITASLLFNNSNITKNGSIVDTITDKIESFEGTNLSDTITAYFGSNLGVNYNDTIKGLGGNDSIESGLGDDIVDGGDGDDIISGGEGNDTINGGTGTNKLIFTNAINGVEVYLDSTNRTNTAIVGGYEVINDGFGTKDQITNMINITGTSFNDILSGNTLSNIIDGGNGDDILFLSAGTDQLIGGSGNDWLSTEKYYSANVNLGTSSGSTTFSSIENVIDSATNGTTLRSFYGGLGDNIFVTKAGKESIYSEGGNNVIDAGADDDILYVGATQANSTIIIGGTGTDTLSYSYVQSIGSTIILSDYLSYTKNIVLKNVEDLNTIVDGTYSFFQVLNSTNGIDFLYSSDGINIDIENFILSNNNDIFVGNIQSNYVNANGGNDIIYGLIGDDTLLGNSGNDTIDGGEGNDIIDGGIGLDIINGGLGNDTINGFTEDDTIDGGDGNDTIDGGDGNDNINGGLGLDIINGGLGNDIITLSLGNDTIDGGTGTDTMDYSSATEGLSVTFGTPGSSTNVIFSTKTDSIKNIENLKVTNYNDTIIGNTDTNIIYGLGGNDIIDGGAGDDVLYGEAGEDTLRGGSGDDTLDGGIGFADVIDFLNETTGSHTSINVNLRTGIATGNGTDNLSNIEYITMSNGTNTIEGSAIYNYILGGTGIDTLTYASLTSSINTYITGINGGGYITEDGGDVFNNIEKIITGTGNDKITFNTISNIDSDAGSGTDIIDYSLIGTNISAIVSNLGEVTATIGATTNKLTNYENIILGTGNDTLKISSLNILNINGNSGSDTISIATDLDITTLNLTNIEKINVEMNKNLSLNASFLSGKNYNFILESGASISILNNTQNTNYDFSNISVTKLAGAGNVTLNISSNLNLESMNINGVNNILDIVNIAIGNTLTISDNQLINGDFIVNGNGSVIVNIDSNSSNDFTNNLLLTTPTNEILKFTTNSTFNGNPGNSTIFVENGVNLIIEGNSLNGKTNTLAGYGNINILSNGVLNLSGIIVTNTGIINIYDSNLTDTITGTSYNDNIYSIYGGNDVINSGGGNDTIYLGTTIGTISAGAGTDNLNLISNKGIIDLSSSTINGIETVTINSGTTLVLTDLQASTITNINGLGDIEILMSSGTNSTNLNNIVTNGFVKLTFNGNTNIETATLNNIDEYNISSGTLTVNGLKLNGKDFILNGGGNLEVNANGAVNLSFLINNLLGTITINDSSNSDQIVGTNKDELYNILGAGSDSINAGGGNDTIILDHAVTDIYGGSGTDLLKIPSGLGEIDLTGTLLIGIENIIVETGSTIKITDTQASSLSSLTGDGNIIVKLSTGVNTNDLSHLSTNGTINLISNGPTYMSGMNLGNTDSIEIPNSFVQLSGAQLNNQNITFFGAGALQIQVSGETNLNTNNFTFMGSVTISDSVNSDTITGSSKGETYSLTSAGDVTNGDIIYTGSGSDTITLNHAVNTINGGDDTDTLILNASAASVQNLSNVENLSIRTTINISNLNLTDVNNLNIDDLLDSTVVATMTMAQLDNLGSNITVSSSDKLSLLNVHGNITSKDFSKVSHISLDGDTSLSVGQLNTLNYQITDNGYKLTILDTEANIKSKNFNTYLLNNVTELNSTTGTLTITASQAQTGLNFVNSNTVILSDTGINITAANFANFGNNIDTISLLSAGTISKSQYDYAISKSIIFNGVGELTLSASSAELNSYNYSTLLSKGIDVINSTDNLLTIDITKAVSGINFANEDIVTLSGNNSTFGLFDFSTIGDNIDIIKTTDLTTLTIAQKNDIENKGAIIEGNYELTGTTGNDNLILDTFNYDSINLSNGNDTVSINSTNLNNSDVIDFGIGTDILNVSNVNNSLTDYDFSGISNVEQINFSATDDSINIGTNIINSFSSTNGIINGEAGNDTYTLNFNNLNDLKISDTSGTDTVNVIGTTNTISSDTVFGTTDMFDNIETLDLTSLNLQTSSTDKEFEITDSMVSSWSSSNSLVLKLTDLTQADKLSITDSLGTVYDGDSNSVTNGQIINLGNSTITIDLAS